MRGTAKNAGYREAQSQDAAFESRERKVRSNAYKARAGVAVSIRGSARHVTGHSRGREGIFPPEIRVALEGSAASPPGTTSGQLWLCLATQQMPEFHRRS